MRELTGDTRIRIKRPRPELTGDTRIRLSQIKDLADWVEDKHDKADWGTVREWADGKLHVKTPHGWKLATQAEVKRAKKVGPVESYTKASRQKAKTKHPSTAKKMQKLTNKNAIHQAIEEFQTTQEEKKYDLGKITPAAKTRIKKKTGLDPERVILETSSLTHALKDSHNLQPGDLDKMKEMVDTCTDITLSPKPDKSGQPVIIFKQQEPNGVNLLMEFRAGKLDLELQTAYRQKKAPKK